MRRHRSACRGILSQIPSVLIEKEDFMARVRVSEFPEGLARKTEA
jgi:hypothetical protein